MTIKTKAPLISAVVAMAENRAIGKDNQLLWRLPADWQHFKSITMGHPIIMGRKTYESIGKPLPGRTNIVITRNTNFKAPGCIIVVTLEEAVQVAAKENSEEIFIIGGAEIYQQALSMLSRIYLTIVHHEFAADTFFPALNKEWRVVSREEHVADEKNPYAFSFLVLER